ncbi:MAG: septum formation initiator family protein [Acidobacteriota bacterium]
MEDTPPTQETSDDGEFATEESAEETLAASDQASFAGRRWALVFAAVFLLGFVAVGAVQSYSDLSASRARIAELESEIARTQERIDGLKMLNDSLRSDRVLLEYVAREDLGLVRPDEIVLALDERLR